ncbi:GIY-YIG nuclease family protein [Iningainema tapete]|uniref:GIY-YIG nuclease family protein n=1 Tax=Iningainema tapete BLCC-T55 TaxID=2748662 RepID=A0A8J7BWH7_9CYAN|nr:GIY-YIG nuclease family protein [Iningainema tapete]MBD2770973.1 GIY-YIG nuclease family protein [Iningainema tapete BLCC-T55]
MWLNYGVDSNGALIFIDDVLRGKSNLVCPYCAGRLTAKKGQKKEHHFAHTGETCRAVERPGDIPTLPLFDKFNLELTSKELEALKKYWHGENIPTSMRSVLANKRLLQWNDYKGRSGGWEFTKLGKIPLGELSLQLFNEVQEPLIEKKLRDLQREALKAYDVDSPLLQELLVDIRLYRAQLKRILSNTLYFLEVQADGQTFYKIGVTRREVAERVTEVQAELRSHFTSVTIKILDAWGHRGNIELYFKHRFQGFNHPIGSLTEYYKFDDVKSVLRELRRMKPKTLTQLETDIMEGKPDQVEALIEADLHAAARSQAIKVGLQRAQQWGVHVGRSRETEEEFLQKPSTQAVVEALKAGLSLRKAASKAGVSVNTVRKVQAFLFKANTTI